MKKIFFLSTFALFFAANYSSAQVSINVNFGTPPVWAPADRVEVQYYYLPDIDVYYDVPQRQYIYLSNSRWVRTGYLPQRCRNYNLRGGNIVYLTDYRGNSPYAYHKNHKVKYYHPQERVVYVNDDDDDRDEHHDNGEHRGKGKGKNKHRD
ncbi:hypothetical protein OX283_013730 [Flavobacterium sp. SUN052]|uniref:hypothetical protein n=1 Tax=Flavobacterium sp. SUN052 TaxID=3002441 RepID=UPI00237DE567|nr:hypothetical protein [Flavobacterium sp. SUN052]MEC4005726.1 hypothetical protein [Flavobacterium sp. SUN052]